MTRPRPNTKLRKIILIIGLVLIVGVVAGYFSKDWLYRKFFEPTATVNIEGITKPAASDVEVIARNLNIPWEVAFLPSGQMLVTERPGKLKLINEDRPPYEIDGVRHVGEGGLLGMAVHPDFKTNHFIYLYLTTASDNGLINRVERYRLKNNNLEDKTIIINNIPGASYHDGGRIAFGPDRMLYIGTGDAGKEAQAQNNNSLSGKILRLTDDGRIPGDNPFGNNAVYALGLRNPQGLAWDDKGRLWATDHGPSGNASGHDELNLIEAGKNYGWPTIKGDQRADGMVTPKAQSGSDETWAPAGMAFYNGSLFFAGLRGETLYQAKIDSKANVQLINHLREQYGRLRSVALGPDRQLYITTSNRDGRGDVSAGDDKLIRINPNIFK